jgi:hypothetical protein
MSLFLLNSRFTEDYGTKRRNFARNPPFLKKFTDFPEIIRVIQDFFIIFS